MASRRALLLDNGRPDSGPGWDGAQPLAARIAGLDWAGIEASLETRGYATTGVLISAADCRTLAGHYDNEERFRSRIIMQRHAFGRGEYKYFRYPLPAPVESLRQQIYPRLVRVANRWREALKEEGRFPATLDAFLSRCHVAGQVRPTPLLLKYTTDDYNCLHQDLYGTLAFPLQLTVLLSEPNVDFCGGEFLLVEQRPRAQSKGEVIDLARGEAVIFAVHHRPVQGTRGIYRVKLRHGVSRVRSGQRYTLGVIFHDAA